MAELSSASWARDYEGAKAAILAKRSLGTLVSADELRRFQGAVLALERGLQTMQASPMSFEITISEISRRCVRMTTLCELFACARPARSNPLLVSPRHAPPLGKS